MQFHLLPLLLVCALCLLHAPIAGAHEANVQVIFAAEMPDIADPEHSQYAQLKQLIDDERSHSPATFFIFGGGSIGPSALANLDRGSHIIDILNSLEPDAMGVSKREFSFNIDELSLRSYEAAFPIVASNLIDKRINDIPNGLVDSALISRNNVELGFISVSDKRLVEEYLLNDIIVQDKETMVRQTASVLRENGAEFIILHYYDIFQETSKLLDEKIIDYAFISATRKSEAIKTELAKDPRIITLDKQSHALVASFDRNNTFALTSLKDVDLSTLSPDPAVSNQVNSYLLRLNRLLDDDIAFWDGTFTTRRDDVRSKENAFANFVVDAMRSFSNADVAIINGGSIRGNTTYENNTQISRRTIATELPYRSILTVISVSGGQLLEALEVGFAGLDMAKGTFPQVSGMHIVYDSSAAQGARVVSVTVGNEGLNKDKQYRIATTEYLASGGDGYLSLSKNNQKNSLGFNQTILISDLVLQTLRVSGRLNARVEQRLVNQASEF